MHSVPTSPSLDDPNGQPSAARSDLNHYRLAMAILWTVVIMILCWLPPPRGLRARRGSPVVQAPQSRQGGSFRNLCRFFDIWLRVASCRRRFAWVTLGGFALAALTELVQRLPAVGRDGSISDALTDAAGLLVGIVAAPLVEPFARYVESRILGKGDLQPVPVNGKTMSVDQGTRRQTNAGKVGGE